MPFVLNFSTSVISSNPGQTTGTVEIEVTAPQNMVAPSMVTLKAINHSGLASAEKVGAGVYDYVDHEYFHVWTINGQPLSAFSAPENMPTEWNNPNLAYGRRVDFCLPEVGDYVIDLWVVDKNGITAAASTGTLTVEDPDTFFLGKTFVVSNQGEFASAPVGRQFSSINAALRALTSGTNDQRILLKRGEVYDEPVVRRNSGRRWSYLGAWGDGAKPVVRNVDVNGSIDYDTTTVTGIRVLGTWDAATERETGDSLQTRQFGLGFGGNLFANPAYTHDRDFLLIYDCAANDFNTNLRIENNYAGDGDPVDSNIVIANCDLSRWKNFGCFPGYVRGTRVALVGNKVVQHVEALNGGAKGLAVFNQHGPVRVGNAAELYVAQNDMFSRSGWSGADQPCLRGFSDHETYQKISVERNVMEGGFEICRFMRNDGRTDIRTPCNGVVENNLLICTAYTTGPALKLERGGLTARNNYIYAPDLVEYPFGGASSAFLSATYSAAIAASGTDQDEPVAIYSNSALSDMTVTGANNGRVWQTVSHKDKYYSVFTDENNILHSPNSTAPSDLSPVSVSEMFSNVTTRYQGVRHGFAVAQNATTVQAGGCAPGQSLPEIPYDTFTQTLLNGTTLGDNNTDQVYWQAREAAGSTNHLIYIRNNQIYACVANGDISVTFTATGVVIRNDSSDIWGESNGVVVSLDRTDQIPAMDTTYASDGRPVPILRPLATSDAFEAATGTAPPQDLFFAKRPDKSSQGAVEPLTP